MSATAAGYHSPTQKVAGGGVGGSPGPDKEGRGPGSFRSRFSHSPPHLTQPRQRSNGKKEEQDSEFPPFYLTGLANDGC